MVLVILKVSWLAAEISSIECVNPAIEDFAWLAPRLEEQGFLLGPRSPSQRVGRSAPGDWTPLGHSAVELAGHLPIVKKPLKFYPNSPIGNINNR